jgi:hypothetical protein
MLERLKLQLMLFNSRVMSCQVSLIRLMSHRKMESISTVSIWRDVLGARAKKIWKTVLQRFRFWNSLLSGFNLWTSMKQSRMDASSALFTRQVLEKESSVRLDTQPISFASSNSQLKLILTIG